jgi:hypothetical protein
VPHATLLGYPNLIKDRSTPMTIACRSYSGGNASVVILRANGERVRELWKGTLQAQEQFVLDWDVRDDLGQDVASGISYIVFTDGDGRRQIQKALVVR